MVFLLKLCKLIHLNIVLKVVNSYRHRIFFSFVISIFTCILLLLANSPSSKGLDSNINHSEVSGRYFGEPVAILSMNALQEYEKGFNIFIKNWTVNEGLGPLFNAQSCVNCHRTPLPGGSGTTRETFVSHSNKIKDATNNTALPLFKVEQNGEISKITLPQVTTLRKTQPLFGLGLLEAVPDEVILAYSDPEDKDSNGISGRPVQFDRLLGRFGWKGNIPTIEKFVENAFNTELGLISNILVDNLQSASHIKQDKKVVEVSKEQIHLVSQFIRFLAAPPPPKIDQFFLKGEKIFERVNCTGCHRPKLLSEYKIDNRVKRYEISAYTDLLVHDMGASLSDNIENNNVSKQEFRTPPLWGLSFTGPPYLHDGRAFTIEQAIEAHAGEADKSLYKYRNLSREEHKLLLTFLKAL